MSQFINTAVNLNPEIYLFSFNVDVYYHRYTGQGGNTDVSMQVRINDQCDEYEDYLKMHMCFCLTWKGKTIEQC